MNLAVSEAIFRSRREGLTRDTLHLWQGSKSVILGDPSSYSEDVNHEACRKYGIQIIRAISVSAQVFYQDTGSLNFAIATNAATFAKNNQPVLSEYQILNEGIAAGLQKLGLKANISPNGIYINNKTISEAIPKWFYDFLLFQGTLHVDTDLEVYSEVTRTESHSGKENTITSLSLEFDKKIRMDEVKDALVQGIEKSLGIKFEKQGLTKDERSLTEKLYRVKYGVDGWNVHGREPFLVGMGKMAIEVFVAYPPTSKCRELIKRVNDSVSNLQDEVEITIWMRGKGVDQHGPYPEMSSALIGAKKHNIIPAIIINGKLAFSGSIPSKENLRQAILNEFPKWKVV